ncbi:MAG: hypothetical protein ACRCWJ_02030 [Casimicrobium sp.]
MKTASLLTVLLVSSVAAVATAGPTPTTATLNAAAAHKKAIHDLHEYGGPKANPNLRVVVEANQARTLQGVDVRGALIDDYCGTGPKPIPGVRGGGFGGGLANDLERCGTRVPGRIPGGVGPVGPR